MATVNISFYTVGRVMMATVINTKGAVSETLISSDTSTESTKSSPFRSNGLLELNSDGDVWFKLGEDAALQEGVFLKAGIPKVVEVKPGITVSVIDA